MKLASSKHLSCAVLSFSLSVRYSLSTAPPEAGSDHGTYRATYTMYNNIYLPHEGCCEGH